MDASDLLTVADALNLVAGKYENQVAELQRQIAGRDKYITSLEEEIGVLQLTRENLSDELARKRHRKLRLATTLQPEPGGVVDQGEGAVGDGGEVNRPGE